MAHEIETAIFSAREGAGWTELGQVIPQEIAKDPRKIAALVGANFQVLKRPCFYLAADGSHIAAPGRDVLIRSDNGHMLEVVSDTRYHVVNRQPEDLFEAFRDELAANNLEISHAAVLRGGATIAVCAMLPRDLGRFSVGGTGTDVIDSYVTLATGYDKKTGTTKSAGRTRVVCANTLAASIREATASGKLRTIRASTQMHETSLKDLLAGIGESISNDKAVYNALANTAMSATDITRYFADVLEINIADLGKFKSDGSKLISTKSENMLRELAAAYSSAPGAAMATGTAWGALNAVTYYATHVKTCRDTSGSGNDAARVASNLNGDAAKLKQRALELASRSFAIAA